MNSDIQQIIANWPHNHDQLTAADLADRFLLENQYRLSNERRLLHWKGDFYLFDQTHFRRISKETFRAIVVSWLQRTPALRKFAKTSPVANLILNIEGQSKIDDETKLSTFLGGETIFYPNWINMKNGILDIESVLGGEMTCFYQHSPRYFSTVCLPYAFQPGAQCPTWINFIEKMQPDPEVRSLIQEWFGYNLVFDTTQEKFVLFVGEGANGKTVFCVALRSLLGVSNVSAVGLEAFSPTRTFPLASTIGKLANIVEEMNEVDRAAEGELKKFVSGGLITAEQKYRDPFEFRPSSRLTFASNVLPKFSDRSDGLWRRLLLIPCSVQIKNERDQDKRLINPAFWEQSGELPGIFNWSLDGLHRLRSRGYFLEPTACVHAKARFRKDSNPAKSFLHDFCRIKVGSAVSSRLLYENYCFRVRENGQMPLGEPGFCQEVKRVFPETEKSANAVTLADGRRGHVWCNLEII